MHHDKAIQIRCELVCDGGSAIDILLLATAKYYVHNNCFCISLLPQMKMISEDESVGRGVHEAYTYIRGLFNKQTIKNFN